MGDAVADPAHLLQQPLEIVEHDVDAARQPVELVAGAPHGQPLAQVAAHHAPDGQIDRGHAVERPAAQRRTAAEPEEQHGHEAEAQRAKDHRPGVVQLVEVEPQHDQAPVGQREGGGAERLVAAVAIGSLRDDLGRCEARLAVGRHVRRPAEQVAEDSPSTGIEQRDVADVVQVLGEPRLEAKLDGARGTGGDEMALVAEHLVELGPLVARRLPVHEGEEHERQSREGAGDRQRPAEGRRADEVSGGACRVKPMPRMFSMSGDFAGAVELAAQAAHVDVDEVRLRHESHTATRPRTAWRESRPGRAGGPDIRAA